MFDFFLELLKIIGLGTSEMISAIIAFGVLGIAGYLFIRKTSIEEVTSAGALHTQQIDSLIKQVTLLSEELTLARAQLKEIHDQNVLLMQQVRDSTKRIQELEDLLSRK
jgi:hypothetical protein